MSHFADMRRAGRRGRRAAFLLVFPLVLAVLPAIAGADDTGTGDTAVDHRVAVHDVRGGLADMTGLDGDTVKHRKKAIEHLDEALASEAWTEGGSALTEKGNKVFDELAKAVKDLDGWDASDLVDIARTLASEAIEAAAGAGVDVAKANEEFTEAETEAKDDKRISGFGRAWDEARKATEKAAKEAAKASGGSSGSGTFGNSHVYTFTMVNADGDELVVSGSSGSNEGYLFDAAFTVSDTKMDQAARTAVIAGAVAAGVLAEGEIDPVAGGVIQVHVSCSDAFLGGVGQKSDPAPTAMWLVKSAHIDKDGKECDIVGTSGGGTPPGGPPSVGFTACFQDGYPTADGTFYEFRFVPRSFAGADEVPADEVLTVCGNSDGNEGFLEDDAFDPPDTYTGVDGQIQVHVSCSDAFAGGIGQKSDPTAESQWLVNTAYIVKLDNGEVRKDCDVVGSGIPVTDPPVDPPVGNPSIDVEKRVRFVVDGAGSGWSDADEPDPLFGTLIGAIAQFEITLTNTGDADLVSVAVSDSVLDLSSCAFPTELAAGASAEPCLIDAIASQLTYQSFAEATAVYSGEAVSDIDWVYFALYTGG